MDEFLKPKIHHSGEFIDYELSVYNGGLVDNLTVENLTVEVDKWGYFNVDKWC